jgi:hypothetical protein
MRRLQAQRRCFTQAGFWSTFSGEMPQSNPPPSLPEVYDEANDSPRWLPALGFGLFALFAAVFAASWVNQPVTPPTAAPPSDQADQAEPARG